MMAYTTDNFCKKKHKNRFETYGAISIGDTVIFDFWKDNPEYNSKVISIFVKMDAICVQVDAKWQGLKPYTTYEHVIKKNNNEK